MSTWTSLKIELIATGDQSGLWGVTTNNNFQYAIEEAITGTGSVTFASNNQTLTLTNSNLSQTGRKLRLNLTGVTGGSTRTLFVPAIQKQYIVNNACADSILVTNGTDPTPTGTGVTVPAGRSLIVFNDGTNITGVVNYAPSLTLGAALAVGSGGTGQTSFTGNGALYANAGGTAILSNTLPVASGGTGAVTYGTGLVKANGTAAFTTAVSGTDYAPAPPATTNILTGNGAGGFSTVGVPSPGFLQWTGSAYIWNTAIGSGSVTLIDASGGTTGMTFSGGPVTTIGTLTLGGTLNVANGGTGQTSFTANGALFANGAGTAIASGTLPIPSGGTGITTITANGALYGNGTGTSILTGTLPPIAGGTGITSPGALGNVLTSNGAGSWTSVAPPAITSTAKIYFMAQF